MDTNFGRILFSPPYPFHVPVCEEKTWFLSSFSILQFRELSYRLKGVPPCMKERLENAAMNKTGQVSLSLSLWLYFMNEYHESSRGETQFCFSRAHLIIETPL